ncbi:uncharacterized protein LOC131053828 [Cryptomeria japonica]|uniref:uncharacterized protein LOC131053828 n=1 Tax=Cryptomeria japonica TaxID=3369 RepID=UPI0027DA78F3|nr:uncharacterized protein LOC131053828 [Cryptomeria japonica]
MEGSSRGNPGPARIGGVGRSNDNKVVFFFSAFKGVHSNNLMETLEILYAIEKRYAPGWRRIDYESDSQIIIDMLSTQSLGDINWQLAMVARQILNLCLSLEYISFSHIPHEWNRFADWLAQWAIENSRGWNVEDRGLLSPEYFGTLDKMIEDDQEI